MTYLLDVNVLIALAWPTHVHHVAAQTWFGTFGQRAWATCPLTQAAFVRISSNPKFIDGAVTPSQAAELLSEVTKKEQHEFWPDDVSLLDAGVFDVGRLHGSRQITDAYLLALAIGKGGRFVTFDEAIPLSAVRGASKRHLLVL